MTAALNKDEAFPSKSTGINPSLKSITKKYCLLKVPLVLSFSLFDASLQSFFYCYAQQSVFQGLLQDNDLHYKASVIRSNQHYIFKWSCSLRGR